MDNQTINNILDVINKVRDLEIGLEITKINLYENRVFTFKMIRSACEEAGISKEDWNAIEAKLRDQHEGLTAEIKEDARLDHLAGDQ